MEEINKIKTGDFVQLKLGGPIMIVNGKKTSNGILICVWFNKNNDFCTAEIFKEALDRVDKAGTVFGQAN